MNRVDRTNGIFSKTVIVTLVLMLIYFLSIGVSCQKKPGSLKSQTQSNKSSNTSVSKTKGDRSTKRMPTLPGAEGQTKVDTMTLEILDAMANCWSSYLNDPNNSQLRDKAAQADKVQTEKPNNNQHLNAKGR